MKTASKTYSIEEFEKLYRQECFDFDLQGHHDARDHIDSKILSGIKRVKEIVKKLEEEGKTISIFNRPIEVGEPFRFSLDMVEFNCEHCGSNVYLGLIDEKTISIFELDTTNHTFNYNPDSKCIYEDGIPHHKAILNLENELVFINAFRNDDGYLFPDAPEDKKYDDEYSLSTPTGLQGITKHKEGLNVGFGQMSNMSIGIYANKNRDHLIISNPYLEDYEEIDYDKEVQDRYKKTLEWLNDNKYEMLGSISLGVWRWEATDKKTLDAAGWVEEKHKRSYDDIVKVKIPSGKWEVNHMFNSYDFGFNFSGPDFHSDMEIYSELKLIKE